MKRPQLKFILLVPALAFIAAVANTGYSQSCMGSSITASDLDIVPEKLQVGKSARVRVRFSNSGRCQWLKDAVTLSIIVKTKPPGSPSSFREIPTELPQRSSTSTTAKHTWYFDITGPKNTGDYTLVFQLTERGKEFGAKGSLSFEVVEK